MNDGLDKKKPEKNNSDADTNQQKPEYKTQVANIDDLKAKLGLTQKPKPKPKTTQPKPVEKKPESRQAKPAQNFEAQYDNTPLDEETLASIRGGRMRWPMVVAIVGIFALLIGILFGKIMRDRKIDNRRTEEARFLLHYLEHARGTKLNREDGTILETVQTFNEKVHTITKGLTNANTPQKKQTVQKSLEDFLKNTQKFVGKSAYFSFDSAFPNVIYNQKIAFKVAEFINYVHEFNRLATLLAKEAKTWQAIAGPDPTKKQYQYIEIKKLDENGFSLNEGTWLEAVDWKRVQKQRGVTLVPVKPFGAKEGYYLPVEKLSKLDVTPMARLKASVYKQLIFRRVMKGVMQLKLQGDKLDFPTLKKEIQHYANREMLFTMF